LEIKSQAYEPPLLRKPDFSESQNQPYHQGKKMHIFPNDSLSFIKKDPHVKGIIEEKRRNE